MNWKRGMYSMATGVAILGPAQHIYSTGAILNSFYELPKNRVEANIFAKEIFRVPNFWKDLAKKMSFGMVAAAGDTAIKLSVW
jgi:hypothetical protein